MNMTNRPPAPADMTEAFSRQDTGETKHSGTPEHARWDGPLTHWIENHPVEVVQEWIVKYGLRHQLFEGEDARRLATDILTYLHHHDEALRWSVFYQLDGAGIGDILGSVGLSVFWSGGSLTPEGQPPVYPPAGAATKILLSAGKQLVVLCAPGNDLSEGVRRFLGERPD
ncbi:hypothetical protein BH006_06870 [Salmonella enterica]|uniref:Uncharacterized protein n=2 Tax=Salmonella enterica TaxID=28901 RepID=A0A3F3I8M8_SALER|nr:hypothetical protein [Salmonella enterica]OEH95570.1 hypothetical protein BH006_06870 [Salmonella enterica]